jgi:uncharacterized protein YodC (DUF2158 family)
MDIKVGDIVTLKSGGPNMTAGKISNLSNGDAFVSCYWFVNGEVKTAGFAIETLKLVQK